MPKKKGVAKLKKDADKWFSKYVRLRDSNDQGYAECISCGVQKNHKQMQAGHFVSRRVNALRYDEENVNAQCVGCNMFKQGEQYQYGVNLDYKYGEGTAEKLMGRRNETHKLTITELEEIINDSKEQVKHYEHTIG